MSSILRAAVLIYSALICVSIPLTSFLANDDHMYLGAAHLVGRWDLYRDFSYAQTPYMPYVFKFAFDAFGGLMYVHYSRIVEALILIGIVGLTYGIASRLSGNRWYGAFSVFLLVGLGVFQDTIHFARNYNLAMLLCLAAIYVVERRRDRLNGATPWLLAGLFSGLAVGVKLTFLTFLPFFCLVALIEKGVSRDGIRLIALYGLGVAVALLPALYVIYRSGFEVSFFNFLAFFDVNIRYRTETNFEGPMALPEKLQFARQILIRSSLLVLLVGYQVLSYFCNPRPVTPGTDRALLQYVLLVLATAPMFLLPSPVWTGYFSMFVLALVLFSALMFSRLNLPERRPVATLAIAVCGMMLFTNVLLDARRIGGLANSENWLGYRVHRIAGKIRDVIPPSDRKRPVATVTPIYALEAGLPVYRELATGPFYYRVGHLLTEDQRSRYAITSRDDLARLLDATRPSAILVGYEEEPVEKPFVDYATSRGYEVRTALDGGGTLYTRKAE